MRLKLCWKPCVGSPVRREIISPFCTAADEGITGTSVQKRDDFKRMLADSGRGLIDRILVKSISRFARNTAECLEAIRQFRANGTTIFFEKENIDTDRMSSELMTALYAAFSQSESESISGNMRWSYQRRMERGKHNPQSAGFGYCLKDGKLAIVPEEAKIVRFIFESYLSGASRRTMVKQLNARREVSCGTKAPFPISSQMNAMWAILCYKRRTRQKLFP